MQIAMTANAKDGATKQQDEARRIVRGHTPLLFDSDQRRPAVRLAYLLRSGALCFRSSLT